MRYLLMLLILLGLLGASVQFVLLVLNSTALIFGEEVVHEIMMWFPFVIAGEFLVLIIWKLHRLSITLTERYGPYGVLAWLGAALIGSLLGMSLAI